MGMVIERRKWHDGPGGGASAVMCRELIERGMPTILGDGVQTRGLGHFRGGGAALLAAGERPEMVGQVAQVGTGKPTTLLELVQTLAQVLGKDVQPVFGPPRAGDIRLSCANLDRIGKLLGYRPTVSLTEGLRETLDWMRETGKAP